MESVNIPKTQRRLTELEKEELKKIKDAILNSGVTVETATKENMASWLSFDTTVEMIDVFATGELNKEDIFIFGKGEWEKLEKKVTGVFDFQKIENKIKKFKENDKLKKKGLFSNLRALRAELLIEGLWGQKKRMTELFFETVAKNEIKITKKETNALEQVLIGLSVIKTERESWGQILMFLRDTKSETLEKETCIFEDKEFEELKERREACEKVINTLYDNFEEFEFDDLSNCKSFLKEITGLKEALSINNYKTLKKNKSGVPIILNKPEEEKSDKKNVYFSRSKLLDPIEAVEKLMESFKTENGDKPTTETREKMKEILERNGVLKND